MASSKSSLEDLLGESWVDVANVNVDASSNAITDSTLNTGSQGTITPISVVNLNPSLSMEEYLRLLGEAQRDSTQSSARVSQAGSRKDSPRSSPKSPPNSPVQQGTPLVVDWQAYYMNTEAKELQEHEILNDWSSRPEQIPPKNWNFRTPKRDMLSIRYAKVGDTSVFSRKGLCTLFLTNLISLLLGTGVGLWLSKHGFFVPAVKVR